MISTISATISDTLWIVMGLAAAAIWISLGFAVARSLVRWLAARDRLHDTDFDRAMRRWKKMLEGQK